MSETGASSEGLFHRARKDRSTREEVVNVFAGGYAADFLRMQQGFVRPDQLAVRYAREKYRLLTAGNIDSLTGAFNRKYTNEYLDSLARSSMEYSLVFVDLDNFGIINKSYGHEKGDAVLQNFCHLADESLQSTDLLGRLGGEEFVLAMPGLNIGEAVELVTALGSKVKSGLQSMANVPGGEITMSAGLVYVTSGQSRSHVLNLANNLERESKNLGKNRLSYVVDGKPFVRQF